MLYIVRHGQSEGNLNNRYCGVTDIELSETGKLEALETGKFLRELKVDRIYSSPLKRAYNTALILSETRNMAVEQVECLKEINFGLFENLTWKEIQTTYPEEVDCWIKSRSKYRFPQGETVEDVIERISEFLETVEDNSIIVTHFGVIQCILIYFKICDYESVWDYKLSNCDVAVINNKKLERIIKCPF